VLSGYGFTGNNLKKYGIKGLLEKYSIVGGPSLIKPCHF
jgi:hypothetical protein